MARCTPTDRARASCRERRDVLVEALLRHGFHHAPTRFNAS
jgi:hypothetical protein